MVINVGVKILIIKILQFSGAFAKLRKVTVSFVMSAPLSVLLEQLGSGWTDFHKILYWRVVRVAQSV
jgi:hypothetical protein